MPVLSKAKHLRIPGLKPGGSPAHAYSSSILAGAGIGIGTVLFKHFSQELQFLYIGRFLNNPGLNFGVNASFRYRY
ncbi:MAG: hypothetical protein FD137_1663 [Spirochaetes bacterium]|nr:MAG: hypothetical protein FD137_1663 [Spirochaetota bacterium]